MIDRNEESSNYIKINKSIERENEVNIRNQGNSYHDWFLIHSGFKTTIKPVVKNGSVIPTGPQVEENSYDTNNENSNYDYEIWFKKHSGLLEKELEKVEETFLIYTSLCKYYYPLIIRPIHNLRTNTCNKHSKNLSIFCLTCQRHCCLECKPKHEGHFLIDLEKFSLREKDIIKAEKSVDKISSLFKSYFDEKEYEMSYERIKEYEDELKRFNYYVINAYRNNKNNYYYFFNFYYLFRLHEDLKKKRII
jgi:hypothetical protein